jgi:hypothetical protein
MTIDTTAPELEIAQRRLAAKVAHVSPNTITRCIAGEPIRESTLREVIRALMSLPVMRGSELSRSRLVHITAGGRCNGLLSPRRLLVLYSKSDLQRPVSRTCRLLSGWS